MIVCGVSRQVAKEKTGGFDAFGFWLCVCEFVWERRAEKACSDDFDQPHSASGGLNDCLWGVAPSRTGAKEETGGFHAIRVVVRV